MGSRFILWIYWVEGLFGGRSWTGFDQEVIEEFEIRAGEVGEEGSGQVGEGFVQLGKKLEAFGGDVHEDDASVIGGAISGDEALRFEAVDESCDIGYRGEEMMTDLGAGASG